MTSMETFPVGTGRFAPEGTSILAPGDTLYAGLDKVAICLRHVRLWMSPDQKGKSAIFRCNPAPMPSVARVLVVAGRPILFTDQTLGALDPSTFQSTSITYHPTGFGYGY